MRAPRATALQGLGERIPVARAAQLIGVSDDQVREMIQRRELDAIDVRAPGASRARWSVAVASIRAYLAQRKSALAEIPDGADGADTGERRS